MLLARLTSLDMDLGASWTPRWSHPPLPRQHRLLPTTAAAFVTATLPTVTLRAPATRRLQARARAPALGLVMALGMALGLVLGLVRVQALALAQARVQVRAQELG